MYILYLQIGWATPCPALSFTPSNRIALISPLAFYVAVLTGYAQILNITIVIVL